MFIMLHNFHLISSETWTCTLCIPDNELIITQPIQREFEMLGNGKRKAPGGLVEKEIKVCDCVMVLDPVIIFGLRFAFFTHISGGKTHSFEICALKKLNDFRQFKRSNFRVQKCKTEENLSKFLNNMAYKTVTSMRDCVMNRKLM